MLQMLIDSASAELKNLCDIAIRFAERDPLQDLGLLNRQLISTRQNFLNFSGAQRRMALNSVCKGSLSRHRVVDVCL